MEYYDYLKSLTLNKCQLEQLRLLYSILIELRALNEKFKD